MPPLLPASASTKMFLPQCMRLSGLMFLRLNDMMRGQTGDNTAFPEMLTLELGAEIIR